MSLKDILQETLDSWGWEDEIIHDESDDTFLINTPYDIDNQTYSFAMWTDEPRQWIGLSIKSPLTVPEGRREQAAVLLNFFNRGLNIGRLELDPDTGGIFFKQIIDVEGTQPTPTLFVNLRSAGGASFGPHRVAAMGAIAFTKVDVSQVIEDFLIAIAAPDL